LGHSPAKGRKRREKRKRIPSTVSESIRILGGLGRWGEEVGWRAIKSSTGVATLTPELSRNLARCQRVEAYEISFSFPSE